MAQPTCMPADVPTSTLAYLPDDFRAALGHLVDIWSDRPARPGLLATP